MSSVEQKNCAANVPLPLDRAGRTAAEQRKGQRPTAAEEVNLSAEQLTFRGKPIEWVVAAETKTVLVAKCAFDDEDNTKEQDSARHFIRYDGVIYTRKEFLKSVFQDDYRKYPYKVDFLTDDIFLLSGNQRAKLQYHILAQRFPLVYIAAEDKEDLEKFCRSHKAETAQRWLNRMQWENGHEKLVTFGVAMEKRGKVKGAWCYSAQITNQNAIFHGIFMTWEIWTQPIMEFLNSRRKELSDKSLPPQERRELESRATDTALMMLSYQNQLYMTIPGPDYTRLKDWVYQYFFYGTAKLPVTGEIGGAEYSFTIDFDTDTKIVAAPDLATEMSEYNIGHNKDMGRRWTEERFANLHGDSWTAQEILAQGFSRKTLDKFVKHNLIKRVKRNHYVRNFK